MTFDERDLAERLKRIRQRFKHLERAVRNKKANRKCSSQEHEWKNLDTVCGGECGRRFGKRYINSYNIARCLVCGGYRVTDYCGAYPKRVTKELARRE